MKKELKIEIIEIFMAKAGKNGWDKCFHGTIRRKCDVNGNPFVIGRIKINDGYIIANAKDQWELSEKLDQLVLINLTTNLYDDQKSSLN
jgi:hypothetical protein